MRIIIALLLLLSVSGLAQKKNEKYHYAMRRAASAVKVDGVLDEAAWKGTDLATDFYMILPMDTSAAQLRTEVRLTYDDQNIYISAVNFQTGNIVVESMRRDWNFGRNDNFIFFLDTFDDQTNGFTFGANAAGAQWDGLQFDGGSANLNWDNKWTSAVKRYADRWVFEAAIPFKTIRYKKGINRWGINFSRQDLTTTEKSSWAPVPRQFPSSSLAYTGVLDWDVPPPAAGPNISLIPYVLGGFSKSINPNTPASYRKEIGGDVKVAVTSSLNLDLTVNPDFSQVEVDRQQTNLDRFELFFPERRQFFLENGDLFNNVGFQTIRPFFSRRIGLGVPIRFGARLSGKLDKDWRIGLMDMQTGAVEATGLPAQNFAVLSLQRRVFARSAVAAYFINKQSLNYTPDPAKPQYSAYNRNVGLEYNLASSNNVWRGKFFYFKSFTPGVSTDDQVAAGNLRYNTRRWVVDVQYENVGNNYNAEVGYVPRRGYQRIGFTTNHTFFPKSKNILSHGPSVFNFVFFNKLFNSIENETAFAYNITFRSRATFTAWTGNNYVKLLSAFDPTNLTGIKLDAGTEHIWNSWGTEFVSRPQGLLTYGFTTRYGGYFANGTRLRLSGDLAYRFQPYAVVSVSAEYNDIKLPAPFKDAYFWLVGPRVDVTFTDKLYLTTFLQYNQQANNVNLNARLQWRYAPASDIFLVYTDNHLPENFLAKNRSLVLKFTYWWNV